jgi:hypothetical protein
VIFDHAASEFLHRVALALRAGKLAELKLGHAPERRIADEVAIASFSFGLPEGGVAGLSPAVCAAEGTDWQRRKAMSEAIAANHVMGESFD